MKKTDIAMIILISSVSILIAYFVAKSVIGDVKNEVVKVKTIDPIYTEVEQPSKDIFNSKAINPTIEVTIGNKKSNPQSSQ